MYPDDFLNKRMDERKRENAFRTLRLYRGKTDFCSNDYLGLVRNHLLAAAAGEPGLRTGSTGSRLLSGNYPLISDTEEAIAVFHETEAALIFNSGYDANVGILSSVPRKGDTVIYDFLSHASIRDGVRLSFAHSYSFVHNDLMDLEKKLGRATGNIFVVTESVFSMDGDTCPLPEILGLCNRYNAHLILDEAHATGIIGEKGEGLAQHLRLQDHIFCRVHTFGKACGCHGAVAVGSARLKEYLVNFARSLVYSTALPEHAVAAIRQSYRVFPQMVAERKHLQQLIQLFAKADIAFEKLSSATPIQAAVIPGNDTIKKVAAGLQEQGYDVRPVLYPTVPAGKERLRIVLHAFNTVAELEGLVNELKK